MIHILPKSAHTRRRQSFALCRDLARRRIAGWAALTLGLTATAMAGEKVTIRLEGDILPECAVAAGGGPGGANLAFALDIGSMAGAGRSDYGFTVNCNAPFAYRLEAQYGALTRAGAKPGDGGFAAVLPYRVAIHIPTQRGAIDDICPGESLRAGRVTCPFSTSGNDIALGSAARLSITWEPQGRTPPAGEYVERLTITVATSL